MALHSTCPKCGRHDFEMIEEDIKGSNYKVMFVRCDSCGCVVGVQDYYNIGETIHKLAERLNIRLR